MFQEYQDEMLGLMRLYGIETEAEVFTGCFLKLRNRLQKEKSEIADIVSKLVFHIRSHFRRQFFSEFDVDGHELLEDSLITYEMLLKGSAWYIAAYKQSENTEESEATNRKRLLGLPWFVNDVMLAIKKHRKQRSLCQTLDVRTAVGESLIRIFKEERAWLLEDFKTRLRTKEVVCRHLKQVQPNQSMTMIGSSATLLFHRESDLDLCLLSKDCQPGSFLRRSGKHFGDTRVARQDQENSLKNLVPCLEEQIQSEEEQQEPKSLFLKARLAKKKKFPVSLSFEFFLI